MTIFLSVVFILLISFVMAMLQSAVLQTAKNQKRLDVDRAVYSVFGEYQKQLLEKYDVFGMDAGYGSGVYDEEVLKSRLAYYGCVGMECSVEAVRLLTDDHGAAFREQVLESMEQMHGLSLVQEWTGLTADWEEQEIQAEEVEEVRDTVENDLDGLFFSENAGESEGQPEENEIPTTEESSLPAEGQGSEVELLEGIRRAQKTGLLAQILPQEMAVSAKSIQPGEQISGRSLNRGRGSFPMREQTDGVTQRLFFGEYILDRFSCAVQKEDGGKQAQSLDYEVEYILQGKAGDEENLKGVLTKLLLLRFGANYMYLLTDTGRQAEATTAAATISLILLSPEAEELIQKILVLFWAYGESVQDLRALLAGNRTAFVKTAETWQTPLSSLARLGTSENLSEGRDVEGGIDYAGYLRILLFLASDEGITLRTMDRAEQNLRMEEGQSQIHLDHCITALKLENRTEIYGGLNYQFPCSFAYQ